MVDAFGLPNVLPPIVEEWCGILLRHGERTEHHPDHPWACMCGAPEYLHCEDYLAGDGFIGAAVIYRSGDDGAVMVHLPEPPTAASEAGS